MQYHSTFRKIYVILLLKRYIIQLMFHLILESAKSNPKDIVPGAILHVGKFNQAKRQDKLIRAYYDSKCTYPLIFIGKGPLLEQAKDLSY